MALWHSDEELFQLTRRELFTALVGDAMDKMGLQHQFLPQQIKPLRDDMVVIGRTMPVLEADVFEETAQNSNNPVMTKPFGLMFEALDDLKPGEVYVCTGGTHNYALWGGLMSTRALHLKAAGAVVDGFSRDTREIKRLNFATFSRGMYAQDQGPRGKVIDFRIAIEIGQVHITPGDIIYGDLDGVLVVPQAAVEEAFTKALEKARGEQQVRKAIEAGMSAAEAFKTFGIM